MNQFYRKYFKRNLDFLLSSVLLLLSSPLFMMVTIAIKLTSRGPIFFTQERAGLHEKPFKIYKFRSMRVQQEDPTLQAYLDDPRITRVGYIIRRFKIDELPQLWNVFIGDMSLVGPRPTLEDQKAEYTPHQMVRYNVRPGLTGWAQVNGNIKLSVHDRREHDVYYVEHLSLWLDFKILLMTVSVVLFGEKVRNRGNV
jgi:undecaprenyl phosphate N,N'-diacetylbacillosamine 1-phosphate transferase